MAAVQAALLNKDVARDTALKLYTGEVIKAFREKNIGLGLVSKRMISGGKSAQWIVTGKADEADIQAHARGAEVVNQLLDNDEVTITVTTRYVHSHFIDGLDVRLAQYEASTELAFQSGEVLATKVDKDIFKTIGNNGPAFIPLPGQQAAGTVVATGYTAAAIGEDRGNVLISAMFEGRTNLDVKNVTAEATFVTAPVDYYNLAQSKAVNFDWTNGSNGTIDQGNVQRVAGIPIMWTNHLDKVTNTKLLGLLFTKDVLGVVSAMDITSEIFYDNRRLGSQYTSYYALGMGILNPTGLEVINDDSI